MNPYIVSCDLGILWRNAGFSVPGEALDTFRTAVQQALRESVGENEWVPEQEMKDGLAQLTDSCSMPIVSLDPVYAPSNLHMSLTRLVDDCLADASYGARDGTPVDLRSVVGAIVEKLPERNIALVDDVLFSGAMMVHIISLFAERDVRVRRVFAGIAIGEGVDRLRAVDCPVSAVRLYQEVTDEICERDFLPGAPMSGRTVCGRQKTGAPYLLPFGKPGKWASIPDVSSGTFSKAVLHASADFYETFDVNVGNLPRRILSISAEKSNRVSDVLRGIARSI